MNKQILTIDYNHAYVTLSRINIHKPRISHSRDTTKNVHWCAFRCTTGKLRTSNKHNTLIQIQIL